MIIFIDNNNDTHTVVYILGCIPHLDISFKITKNIN